MFVPRLAQTLDHVLVCIRYVFGNKVFAKTFYYIFKEYIIINKYLVSHLTYYSQAKLKKKQNYKTSKEYIFQLTTQ